MRWRQEMWHLSVSVDIRPIYIWLLECVCVCVCSNIAYRVRELFFFSSEDYSAIVAADTEHVHPDCPNFHQTAHFELNAKCLHILFFHEWLYNSYTSINAFTAFLCSKKQSHCNLLSHTHGLYIFIYTLHMLNTTLNAESLASANFS